LGVEYMRPIRKAGKAFGWAPKRLTFVKLSLVGPIVHLMQVKDIGKRVRHSQGVRKDIPP